MKVALGCRTEHSFRLALGRADEIVGRLADLGYTHAGIADHCGTWGLASWQKACEKHDIVPIYGVRIPVVRRLTVGKSKDQPEGDGSSRGKTVVADWWQVYAVENLIGIHDLVREATANFYRIPQITPQRVRAIAEASGLVVVEQSRHVDWESGGELSAATLIKFSSPPNPVITQANYYPNEADEDLWRIAGGISLNNVNQISPRHLLSPSEIEALLTSFGVSKTNIEAGWSRAADIADRCKAKLPKAKLPKIEITKTLRELCVEGAAALGCDISAPDYAARLDRELSLITEKQFEDYFFIVSDICQWARQKMFVGPARGSSCGSLVCYLLRITTVDPLPHKLLFERFIDINRDDLPDIDIDFSDRQRHLVFEYIEQKYGGSGGHGSHVARLGTILTYQPLSAIKETAAALGIDLGAAVSLADSIIKRSVGDSRAQFALLDTMTETDVGREVISRYPSLKIAADLEGRAKAAGQHSAGVVIASSPISEFSAIDLHRGTCQLDKYDAEAVFGLLKIDCLGLTTLSTLEMALASAGLSEDFLFSLPTDDPESYALLRSHRFAGIFQFDGSVLRSIAIQTPFSQFEDIVSVTALGRPGPMAGGGAQEWVIRRNGAPYSVHPLLAPYLSDTYGSVIYQEQVLQIGREIGDLSWKDVTALRKAMSKSLGKEYFDQFGDRWKPSAIKKGMSAEEAEKVWDSLCAYGAWAFNRSHSVAYAFISYWCCWLKAHHPLDFYAAAIDNASDTAKKLEILREAASVGISYTTFDPELSTDRWTIDRPNRRLVASIREIKGVGPKTVELVMRLRAGLVSAVQHEEIKKLAERAANKVLQLARTARTDLDSLYPIWDAFLQAYGSTQEANIQTRVVNVCDLASVGPNEEIVVICQLTKIAPRDLNEAINIAKRGGKRVEGPHNELSLRFSDDTGEIPGKVSRTDYERVAKPIVELGGPRKHLWALKGRVFAPSKSFRILMISQAKHLCSLG